MARIRIKDIAEFANVSIGTVDRVIHNREGVSLETREKVRKLLLEYDYKPDIIASSLALKRDVHLAVVMPRVVNEHAFWKLPQTGIRRAIDELSIYGISIEYFYFDQFSKTDFQKQVRNFPYERFHGLLFAPVFEKESATFISKCEVAGIPVVLFNSSLKELNVKCFVGQDAFHSGYVAAKLINYGMAPGRDVAIINMSGRNDNYAHISSREEGFRTYFEEHSGCLARLVTIDLNGVEDIMLNKKLEDLFSDYDIAGLFVTNSRVYKVAEFLANHGAMNVRLVGYDLMPESIEFLKRDYIDFLISQRPEEQAFLGLTTLFNLVAFNRVPDERQFLPIDIITRENLVYYKQ